MSTLFSILDLNRKTNAGGQKAKPKAIKAQSSKNIVRALKPKIQLAAKTGNSRPVSAGSNNRPNSKASQQRPQLKKIVIANNKKVATAKPRAKPAAAGGNTNNNSTKSKLETALQTASAVMRNKQHKNHSEVQQLVDSYKKQWVTEKRFLELLPKLIFD